MEGLMKHLSRREALRGTGVVALAAAGAAAVPIVTTAVQDPRERIAELLEELRTVMVRLHPDRDVRKFTHDEGGHMVVVSAFRRHGDRS
jgi:hypothetical protein